MSGNVVVVNGENCNVYSHQPILPPRGQIVALSGDAAREIWKFTTWFAPDFSGVAIANGVDYCESSGLLSSLYALDLATGKVLTSLLLSGGISGPAVWRGQIYVGTGTRFASGVPSISSIVAFGL